MVDGGSMHHIWVSETASPGQDQDVRPQSGAGTGEDRKKWESEETLTNIGEERLIVLRRMIL